ncbi:MBL fold metallo-hydrolase [Virgibacillus phasianinus]|uniref:MBL fold metallo-hydrolase n=1 Tax=Virgibacillus phasianinus TaxID=2017483 RepID=A0A220U6C8_9BACI|nr:MBL fold metallo-hydrolase [Virgibacillus phasianinus]ASK63273.1 MBL fold metallo-hydrolase [Virgibacillus phasianinus]
MQVVHDTISKLTIPTPFAVGDTHVYLLKGDMLSLIDAGVKTAEAYDALTAQLKDLGYHPNDIEQIILTHHHPDHTGLVERFPKANTLAGHKNNDLWLTRNPEFFERFAQFYRDFFIASGVPQSFKGFLKKLEEPIHYAGEGKLTAFLEEDNHLPGHGDWRVIETKGHAQSHLSFFREQDGAFIGGDHILEHISPNPIIEPPYDGEKERAKPLVQYRANLLKCLSLGISTVYPGHGINVLNIDELVPSQIKRQEQRAAKVLQMLEEDGEQTPFQLCQRLFPKQIAKQLDLTMSETTGQLDYLEECGKIRKATHKGIYYYHVIR